MILEVGSTTGPCYFYYSFSPLEPPRIFIDPFILGLALFSWGATSPELRGRVRLALARRHLLRRTEAD